MDPTVSRRVAPCRDLSAGGLHRWVHYGQISKLSCRVKAVSLEVGVQNYALVLAVCATSFRGCQQVQILTFPLLASLWYVISSALITIFMRVYCWERIEPADVMKAYDVEFSNNKDGGDNNNNNNNKN